MSCKSCEGENPAPMCPSRMAYSQVTDYRPRCAVNAELLGALETQRLTQSAYESRMFLQRNADKFMEQERQKAVARMSPCAPCKRPFTDNGTMAPERFVVRCDGVSCTRTEVNPNGIGDGRAYS